ncbi:2-amino-4-hydroxy-6-hydroxymethyldihydropteridine diphosphokinase [Rhodoferax sp.]|uniref:2-amino-4-hydroxy-6- hydroxymethyldihydropteridine diphosphokinase n=1 Tax=Rhodoferax sp. TaxID=50421 RepID=UPI00283DD73C|nr:2-amino-4-hydroxy-6-hydroxymethyldihydropteridine diphosphokinase [Rhodoferax sp.]MDR3369407.1 2-amino-4-hydroxy-6-hydroxymethyldihydropteridine diphosphokinase [Rhodoferax sp.]
MSQALPAEVQTYVALGANLGDARATVLQAINDLSRLPNTRLIKASSLYRTAPFEASGPDFINAVVALMTRLDAGELLLQLQHLENRKGRERPFKNAPRTLDLDILLYGNSTINTVTLQIPHPRMWERAFVLVPLAEIAPKCVTAEQLDAVQVQRVHRLE